VIARFSGQSPARVFDMFAFPWGFYNHASKLVLWSGPLTMLAWYFYPLLMTKASYNRLPNID
jgi:hypothetical protein